jgi:hypothetical protein
MRTMGSGGIVAFPGDRGEPRKTRKTRKGRRGLEESFSWFALVTFLFFWWYTVSILLIVWDVVRAGSEPRGNREICERSERGEEDWRAVSADSHKLRFCFSRCIPYRFC